MITGFEHAQAEYEAKMCDPYADEDIACEDNDLIDEVEERMLEEQVEGYLFGY